MAKRIRLVCTAAALVPLLVLAAACGSSGSSPSLVSPRQPRQIVRLPRRRPSTPETITETGSTLLFPLFGAWQAAYEHRSTRRSRSPPAGTGSGTGIADAADRHGEHRRVRRLPVQLPT